MASKKITIESLALMVQKGFEETAKKADVDKRFDAIDKRFEQVDKKFEKLETRVEDGFRNVNARLDNLEQDTAEIRKHFIYRYEFEDLMARVKYLEQKLGIESGK